MGKNIVIFSDGTGQEGGKGYNTNVYKLFNMILERSPKQIGFYDRGLGTGWRKFSGMAFGAGIYKNIKECYQFVFENFQAGDQLFLFGFSRGAFTVRSLAGFISLFGVLPQSRPELLKTAYEIYKHTKDKKERVKKAEEFIAKHHTMKCPIKFIGVWDTVGALDIPIKALNIFYPGKHKFHDTDLHENVECGYHALSIDDNRLTFHPTLWNEKNETIVTRYDENENLVKKDQIIRQVWFPGVHTDIGGGYKEHGLSDITLNWMISKAVMQGLKIYKWNPMHVKKLINPDHNCLIHDPQKGIASLYRNKQREFDTRNLNKIVIHQSVLDRQSDSPRNVNKSVYNPWILNYDYEVEPW